MFAQGALPTQVRRQGAGGSGKGRSIREAVRTYSYLCRIDGPQHLRRRRSLTTSPPSSLDGPLVQKPAGFFRLNGYMLGRYIMRE